MCYFDIVDWWTDFLATSLVSPQNILKKITIAYFASTGLRGRLWFLNIIQGLQRKCVDITPHSNGIRM